MITSDTKELALELEEVRQCPLCSGEKAVTVQQLDRFIYKKCLDCGLVRLSNRVVEGQLSAIYGEGYPQAGVDLRLPMFASRKAILERFIEPGQERRFFELGCGDGSFLAYLQKQGWQVDGSEYSSSSVAAIAARFGLTIRQGSAEDLAGQLAPQPMLGFYHVLEHVYHLHDFMAAVEQLVLPGGLIHIQVPNIASLDIKLFGKYTKIWTVPQHVQLFSPDTLQQLLKMHSFEIVKQGMYDPWYSPGIVREGFIRRGQASLFKWDDQRLLCMGVSGETANYVTANEEKSRLSLPRPIYKLLKMGLYKSSEALAHLEARFNRGNVIDLVARKSVI